MQTCLTIINAWLNIYFMEIIILLSLVAGIGGMGLGGLLTGVIGKRSPSMGSYLLSFAGGVMTAVVCFGLVPESAGLLSKTGMTDMMGVLVTILGLMLGIIIVMVLNHIVDKITIVSNDSRKIHSTPEEFYHSSKIDSKKLFRSGIFILIVIALHNIPEGMAIGAGGIYDEGFGFMLAVMIALHNIPEGMAVTAPLIAGGIHKGKAILFTALTGATTLVGALIGGLIGGISEIAVALSLAAAGGAMLYIVFGEIIPQSIIMTKNRIATIVTLAGVIAGLFVVNLV